MTTTTISLADLSGSTAEYLRTEVEVRITDVTRNLGRGDDGTFTVRLLNADRPRGIRLTDVTVHLQVDSPAVILLSARVATVLEARASGDRDDPRLPSDALVGEMFVLFPHASTGFEPNDVLEPGEVIEFEVGYHGESAGTTDITAHLHASFALADLFPRTNGPTVEKSVTIRA
jgi:hypothetical protein